MPLDYEDQAELTAMRSLLIAIAPMAFEAAGIPSANVELLGSRLAERVKGADVTGQPAELAETIGKAYATAVTDLYGEVAAILRVREEEAAKTEG